ncbi:hypothetical protein C8T65DRAFT_745163 [Cerioporus squamosus]|nr:hypothetical protein C8T65DRAFT_745163 [Cerioporus squamosus]
MSDMSWMLCVTAYVLSFADHRFASPAAACAAALPDIFLIMAFFVLGIFLLGVAVVLSGIISICAGITLVQSGLASIHSGTCLLCRLARHVLSMIILGATSLGSSLTFVAYQYTAPIPGFTSRVVSRTACALGRLVLRACLTFVAIHWYSYTASIPGFTTRVVSRIACALGKLILRAVGALFRRAAAAACRVVFRIVQVLAIWSGIAFFEVLSCVVLGSGAFVVKGGTFVGEYVEVLLGLSWQTAMDVCKIVKEESHAAFCQSPNLHLVPGEPFTKSLVRHARSRQSVYYGPLPLASPAPVSVLFYGTYAPRTILSAYTYTYYSMLPIMTITRVIRSHDSLTVLVAGTVHSTERLLLQIATVIPATIDASFLIADDSFETEVTLCEFTDTSDSESDTKQDDKRWNTDKLNPHAPAYTPSASLLAKEHTLSPTGVVKTSGKSLDPRKEAFVPSGLRIIAPMQTSSDPMAVALEATEVSWTPAVTSTPERKPLDPRKEVFVPSRMRVTQEVATALATTLKTLSAPATPKAAQAVTSTSSSETVAAEELVTGKKKHGKRVPTWLRRQRKREREAAEMAGTRWNSCKARTSDILWLFTYPYYYILAGLLIY